MCVIKYFYDISTITKHVRFIQEGNAMQYPGEILFKSGHQVRRKFLFKAAVSWKLKIIIRNYFVENVVFSSSKCLE